MFLTTKSGNFHTDFVVIQVLKTRFAKLPQKDLPRAENDVLIPLGCVPVQRVEQGS